MKGEGGAFRMKEQHKKVFCGNNELGVYEKVKKKKALCWNSESREKGAQGAVG